MQEKTGITYSEEQLNILKETGGIAIRACAGAAKTTVLTHLIAKRILTGEIDAEKTLCTTFSVAGAEEMEQRLQLLLAKMNYKGKPVRVKTLHAVFLEILRQAGIRLDVVNSRIPYLRKALAELKIYTKTEEGNLELNELDTIFSYQINNLVGNDNDLASSTVFAQGTQLINISFEQFDKIRTLIRSYKEKEKVMDFDDIQLYTYILLINKKHEPSLRFIREKYQYLYLDEFQDISKIQFAILREIITNPDNLMVIGDDDQCIYEWRGASPDILNNITAYYPLKQMNLSTNYRCRANILLNAKRGILHASCRQQKEMSAFLKDGEVVQKEFNSKTLNLFYGSSLKMAEEVEKEIKNGAKAENMAILLRERSQADILTMELFRRGIHIFQRKKFGYANNYLLQSALKVMQLAKDPYNVESANKILFKLCPGISYAIDGLLGQIMRTLRCTVSEAIYHLLDVNGKVSSIDDRYQRITDSLRSQIYNSSYKCSLRGFNSLKELLYSLEKYESSAIETAKMLLRMYFNYEQAGVQAEKSLTYMSSMQLYLIQSIEEQGLDGALYFFEMQKAYSYSAYTSGIPCINILTMNESKGREWSTVFVGFLDHLHLPNKTMLEKMLKNVTGLHAEEEITRYMDGERRLFYVACTRAKDKLVLIQPSDINKVSILRREQLDFV